MNNLINRLMHILVDSRQNEWRPLPFNQFLRQAQILIIEISNIFLWLKFLPSLNLNKIEHSAKVSNEKIFNQIFLLSSRRDLPFLHIGSGVSRYIIFP